MREKETVRVGLVLGLLVLLLVPACGARWGAAGSLESPQSGPQAVAEGIRFSLLDAKASKVTIAGDFNNWSATADPLFDREGKGLWTIVLPLAPGSYQYKFVVDGEKWIPDPGNSKRIKDGFDGYNSVIEVAAKPQERSPE